jgi:hypothetical protein
MQDFVTEMRIKTSHIVWDTESVSINRSPSNGREPEQGGLSGHSKKPNSSLPA